MFMIGIDPHKGSHTAAAVNRDEAVIDTIRVDADRHQRARLLAWAAPFSPRTWAIEGATGMGALLAQQLVAAGEHVVDVPPKLSSRVRLLERGKIDKTDPNDARSAAIVAWHNPLLNVVTGLDEHRVVLRLLADRDHQITANRTRTICRLHALLCLLIEGGTGRSLTVTKAEEPLASVHIDGPVTSERVAAANELLNEIRGWAKDTLPTYQDRKVFFEGLVNGEPDPVALLREGREGDVRALIAERIARTNALVG